MAMGEESNMSIEQQIALKNLIYKVRTGSVMYGTHTKDSDEDYGGIFMPPVDYVVGLKRCDQVQFSTKPSSKNYKNTPDDVDYTVYSLPKFIKLAMDNNPNIVEYFFANENCVMECNEYGKRLKDAYPLFISKRAYHTFKGYAYSQLRKLEVKKENMTGRTELAERFGFDTKFASHTVRLLLECQQLLIEGMIYMPLPQNNLVRDIKLGVYGLEWVIDKSHMLEALVDEAYNKSMLQHSANIEAINKLQIELLGDYWEEHD